MAAFQVTKENFDRLVTESSGVVMLDFWSSGCGPCRAMMPTVERLAAEHPDKGFGAVNVDEEPEVAWAFKVMAVPAIVVFKDGNVVAVRLSNESGIGATAGRGGSVGALRRRSARFVARIGPQCRRVERASEGAERAFAHVRAPVRTVLQR